jgi:phage shock protein C
MENEPRPIKRLYRSRKEKMIAGVCGGLAEYFELDPTLVRLVFVALGLTTGTTIILYLLMAIVMPLPPVVPTERSL